MLVAARSPGHQWIRLPCMAYRRATFATETLGVQVCTQIETFSSFDYGPFFDSFCPPYLASRCPISMVDAIDTFYKSLERADRTLTYKKHSAEKGASGCLLVNSRSVSSNAGGSAFASAEISFTK